jgi:hypothetical protein
VVLRPDHLLPKKNTSQWKKIHIVLGRKGDKDLSSRKWIPKHAVGMLISDKIDFKPKLVQEDKEVHFVLMKWIVIQEEITIVNIYVPNVGTPNFIKQTTKLKPHRRL